MSSTFTGNYFNFMPFSVALQGDDSDLMRSRLICPQQEGLWCEGDLSVNKMPVLSAHNKKQIILTDQQPILTRVANTTGGLNEEHISGTLHLFPL